MSRRPAVIILFIKTFAGDDGDDVGFKFTGSQERGGAEWVRVALIGIWERHIRRTLTSANWRAWDVQSAFTYVKVL